MKKILNLVIFIPFLLGCKTQSYNGLKLTLEKDESGELTKATPSELYEKAIMDHIDCVFYIGSDSCSECRELKPKLVDWVKKHERKIYYVELSSITTENVSYINDATTGIYQWGKRQIVPMTYFFMQGETVFGTSNAERTMDFLNTYVNK